MNEVQRNVCVFIVAFFTTLFFAIRSTSSNKVIFCDVGQGTATLLQLGGYQALIDTGPDKRVLNCIGHHIPFFDRTIETVIISHNQKDHNGGLSAIQNKYSVEKIYSEITDTVLLHGKNSDIIIHKASESSKDINESANVVTIKTANPHQQIIFLPSDINGLELKKLIPINTTILAVPHHGSKYGLYPDSLDLAQPTLAVISVGKKNTYGHPSKEALDILKAKNIKVWRTDLQGELVIDL